jgi:hypothetical protein
MYFAVVISMQRLVWTYFWTDFLSGFFSSGGGSAGSGENRIYNTEKITFLMIIFLHQIIVKLIGFY